MTYIVAMRTRAGSNEEKEHRGRVEAGSVINAVGQACLRFGVRTDAIVYLSVELAEGKSE